MNLEENVRLVYNNGVPTEIREMIDKLPLHVSLAEGSTGATLNIRINKDNQRLAEGYCYDPLRYDFDTVDKRKFYVCTEGPVLLIRQRKQNGIQLKLDLQPTRQREPSE